MAQRARCVAREDAQRRILVALRILASEVVLERAIAGTQEAQLVPAAQPRVGAKSRRIGGSHDRQVNILGKMRSDAVNASIHIVHIGHAVVFRLPYI